jgi:hypothetical protein
MGTKVRSAVVVGLLGLLAACADQGTPAADGQSSATAPAATETESSAPAETGECPAGTYQVESLTAKDSVDVSGTELQVADVKGLTLAFTPDGTWTLTGDGATITVSASGLTASATVDGTATGSYAKSGENHVFTQKSAKGQITLDQPVAGVNSVPMSEFGPSIAPSGTATITCTDTGATISAENASLELTGGSGGSGGTGTEPTATEPPAPTGGEPAPKVVNSSGKTGTYSCSGGPVTINGSGNTLTFTGSCEAVNVNGGRNNVTLASVEVINVNGAQNHITWSGTEPQVNNNGSGNTVSQG